MTDIEQTDPQFSPEAVEMQKEQAEDAQEESFEEQFLGNQALNEAYPAPEPEEKMNAHSFLHKAAFGDLDTTRTTWLSESELGRPLFSIRFMLKMEDVAKYYLDDLCRDLKVENKISNYFFADVKNTSDSGMSNKGFAMNLNVTRRMDATKTRIKSPIDNLKGGKPQ